MNTVMLEQLQNRAFELFPFLAKPPVKPLAIGAGRELTQALLPHFDEKDVEQFVERYFSRREYKVALLNCYNADYNRYNLDGTLSDTVVNQDELIGLSRHGMFKDTRGLSPKAAALVKNQRKYVNSRKKDLMKKVVELKKQGFSDQFLIARLGKRIEGYLSAVKYKRPEFSQSMIAEAELMKCRTEGLTKKELKDFQKNLYNQGVPVYLILLASNHYEPLLYELVSRKKRIQKQALAIAA